jgi:hypothetical protein
MSIPPVYNSPQKKRKNVRLIVGLILIVGSCFLALNGSILISAILGKNTKTTASSTPIIKVVTSESKTPTETENPELVISPEPTDSGYPLCQGVNSPKLAIGDAAQVVNVGGYSLIVYDSPSSQANNVAGVEQDSLVIVREGPVCEKGVAYWWKVEFGENAQSGWVMEVDHSGVYYLETKLFK